MTEKIKMVIPALAENFDRINDAVSEFLEEKGCPRKTVIQISICIEEIFVNIAHYAYPTSTGGMAIIHYWLEEPNKFLIRFEDEGIPYDPLAKDDPDITLSAEERSVGGLGIFMVKRYMDDVRYSHEDGKNILTLEKNF